jgi:Flp pilus assembly pilin Flp
MRLGTVISLALRFMRDEKAASLVEYAVALIVVTLVGVAGVNSLGSLTRTKVATTCQSINNQTACP